MASASGGASGSASGGAPGSASGGVTGSASGGVTGSGTGGSAAAGGSAGSPAGAGGRASASGGAAGGAAPGSGGGGGAVPGGFGYGGPSRCAEAGVAFCESFEDGLDKTVWDPIRNPSSLTVDGTRVARGAKSLHITTKSGDFAYIPEMKSFPATNNVLFGRMFLWFEDDITTTGHFSLAEGGGTGDGSVIRFGGQNQKFGVGTDHGASGDWTDKDDKGKAIPSKTWICVEFEFKGDTNEFHVWTDDQPVAALDTGVSKHSGFVMPKFSSLWFGWWMYNMSEPQELWIDEIAVDFERIGCTK